MFVRTHNILARQLLGSSLRLQNFGRVIAGHPGVSGGRRGRQAANYSRPTDGTARSAWTIQARYETPILNFKNVFSSCRSSTNFAQIPWSKCALLNLCIFVVTSFLV